MNTVDIPWREAAAYLVEGWTIEKIYTKKGKFWAVLLAPKVT